jgi:endo-1,4-beta-xylanase
MKQKLLVILAISMCFAVLFVPNVEAQTITSNETGTHDGYDYEFWKDDGGSGSMTLKSGGAFSCEWNNVNNILFRKGRKFDETQTHEELGNISLDYSVNYNPSGNSYMCVYGWTTDPLVEYYIVENWGSWRPPGANSLGTITVDGATYDIYKTTRENKPSIEGTATFPQYWSVRRSGRDSGTISVSEHFNEWESLGMDMGNMYEVAFCVEGYQSSGQADVTSMSIDIGSSGNNDPGDVNNDGSIDTSDYTLMIRHIIGKDTVSSAGDVNGDGIINSLDCTYMKQYMLGIIDSFPVE